jgi:hypothetical protein
MPATFLLPDDVTLAQTLAFGPTAAGATSASQTLDYWYNKGTPGGTTKNLSIQPVNPSSTPPDLASGVPWLDETWIEARANGGKNPSADPAFVSVTTDWYRVGAGSVLPLPDLPGDCCYIIEARLHPPLKDGAPTASVNFKLISNYNESALALAGALSDLGQGIVTGIGDRTVTEFVDAPTVTATGTPDALVHVSGDAFIYRGAYVQKPGVDDLTLNQNDSAAAALTAGHEYKALISQPSSGAAVATKGLLATTGTSVLPALPAGNLLIATVTVAYHVTASVIAQGDITVFAASGQGKPTIGTGLTVNVAALRAIMPGARIINRSARVVTVTGNASPITSYGWLGSSDAVTVVATDSTPPFAGALPLFSCVANATTVTSLTDLRGFFSIDSGGVPCMVKTFSSASAAAVNIADVTVAPGTSASGGIVFEVELSDGTDFAVLRARFSYVATNKAGTIAVQAAPTLFGKELCASAGGGTPGATATVTTGTNVIHLNVVPTWSVMTPTVKKINWRPVQPLRLSQVTVL